MIAWLPPEAVVGEVAVTDKDGSLRVQVSGRLGDVQIEWRADGEHPDEALDELIVHVRRTPSEVLARAYQGRPRRLAVKPSPGLGSASPSSSG